MKFKGSRARKFFYTLSGAGFTFLGVLGTVSQPLLPLGAPFYAVGLPLLVTSHKYSRLLLSQMRAKNSFIDKFFNSIGKVIGSNFLKGLPLAKHFEHALKISDPRLIHKFRAAQALKNNYQEEELVTSSTFEGPVTGLDNRKSNNEAALKIPEPGHGLRKSFEDTGASKSKKTSAGCKHAFIEKAKDVCIQKAGCACAHISPESHL